MMNACETVLDRLPDRVADRLPAEERARVDAHLARCDACRDELAVLSTLAADPPATPPGLEDRIQAAVRREFGAGPGVPDASTPGPAHTEPGVGGLPGVGRRRFAPVPAWGWAAAAVLALLLGRTLVPDGSAPEAGPEFVALTEAEYAVLPAGDIVAGAPVLDGLTDADLNQLLEEWDG